MHQSISQEERRDAWKAIILFMLITYALMAAYISLKSMGMKTNIDGYIHMWGPGISAVLTCLFLKRDIARLPWGWGELRWNWQSLWLPAAYSSD